MKNKWILNFLLIALSFNAVSSLLAMEDNIDLLLQLKTLKGNSVAPQKPTSNVALPSQARDVTNLSQTINVANPPLVTGGQKPLPIDEDATILLKLNPLPAIKNCWGGLVNSVSNRFNSITESASKNNVLAMAGHGLKEAWGIGCSVGRGLASLAGKTSSLYFQKPETLEGFNKGRAIATAVLGISAYFIGKQFYTLYTIRRKIRKSDDATPKGKDFLFGSWKYKTYETYGDISANAERIRSELETEAKSSNSRIYIFDDVGNRINPENINMADIKNALETELGKLRIDLETIGSFTDAPQKILELVCEDSDYKEEAEDLEDLWYQEAPFCNNVCINYFENLDSKNFKSFGDKLINQKCNSYIKRILFTPPGLDFYVPCWRLGNIWYKKATKWYWTVYTRYLRTHALREAISKKTPTSGSQEQPALQKLLGKVNKLIQAQRTAYNSEEAKGLQIKKLYKAWKIANELHENYEQQKNNNFVVALTEINGHFKTINSNLQNTKEKPETDTAKRLLKCVKKSLETLINTEN